GWEQQRLRTSRGMAECGLSNLRVSDELWAIIAPLIPPELTKPNGGRPWRISDRVALTAILFVLKSGIPWEMLPKEMGCGSGMTPGAACITGNELGPGDGYTVCSCRASRRLDASTGSEVPSIARVCRLQADANRRTRTRRIAGNVAPNVTSLSTASVHPS